jgi:hypothetical protein
VEPSEVVESGSSSPPRALVDAGRSTAVRVDTTAIGTAAAVGVESVVSWSDQR